MASLASQVSQGGRIVIPVEMRHKMGINTGDQVLLTWSEESHELRVSTRKQRLDHARSLVKRYADSSDSVVDEFINERRQAAIDE
jgi:AbrB family looped-hinge helix DNA binding protein